MTIIVYKYLNFSYGWKIFAYRWARTQFFQLYDGFDKSFFKDEKQVSGSGRIYKISTYRVFYHWRDSGLIWVSNYNLLYSDIKLVNSTINSRIKLMAVAEKRYQLQLCNSMFQMFPEHTLKGISKPIVSTILVSVFQV